MTDTIARGGIEVYGDSTSFEAAMARAEAAAKRFETGATTSAGKAAASVASVGKDAAKGVRDLDAATKRAVDSLQLMTAKAQLSPAAFQLFKAELRGLNTQAIGPYAVALGKALDQQSAMGAAAAKTAASMNLVGVSAGQATNAMRQLPAQITDIATGLASGQSALTVLIQQGGQLKDNFGGVGNVFRALGSVLTPLRLALGGAAAAVVTLGLAYKQGSAEAAEYRLALALTGNAAGATVGQLQAVAEAVSRSVGTQGQAAAVIAQLAGTGRVAAADLGKLAEAAIRLEREGGPAVEKTVQAFSDLGRDPTAAAVKLNEATNFLTLGLYRQIKALQDQGKEAQAAAVAQEAYATAVLSRTGQLEGSLGTIEKAWRDIKDAAGDAWDAMLGIGRPDSPEQAARKAMAPLEARLQTLNYAIDKTGTPQVLNLSDLLKTTSMLKAERAEIEETLNAQRDALRELTVQQRAAAQGAANRAASVKTAIEADKLAEAAAKRHADELRRLVEAGRDFVQSSALREAGFDPGFLRDMQALQAYAKASGMSVADLQTQIGKLVAQQPFAVDAIKRQVAAYQALAGMQELRAEGEREIIEAEAAARKAREASIAQVEGSLQSLLDEARATDLAAALRITQAQAIERVTLARLEDQRVRMVNDPDELAALERRIELQRQVAAATDQKAARDANTKAAADAAREWERTVDSIRDGLTDAFRRAFESGEDFGTAFAQVIERELKARLATALSGLLADSLMGLVGLQVAGAAGQAGSSSATWLQGANTAGTLYQAYNGQGLVGGAVGYVAASPYAYGAAIGTANVGAGSQAAMLAAQTGEFGAAGTVATSQAAAGAGSGAASWASVGGWVAAAVLGAMKASADYSAGFNSQGARQVSNDTGIYALGGFEADLSRLLQSFGVSDRIADILSGATAVAKLFGRAVPRIDAQGVQGTVQGGDFSGSAFADIVEKGGLFRSDRRYQELSELPDDLGRFLDAAAKSVFDKAREFGDALGLPAETLATVTADLKVALTDDAQANQAALVQELAKYGDALVAGWAQAVAPLAQYGETTVQTIERVGASITGVNDVLQTLGITALQASVDGGRAALALEQMFGGIAGLQQTAGRYLQDYYTDAERAALTTQAIGDALSQVGLALPSSRDGFRSLVEAQDLSTESGRQAFAALMGVADAFAQVTGSAEQASTALRDAIAAALPKFTAADPYAQIATQLGAAGVDVSAAQLANASMQQVYEFAAAFVALEGATEDSKIAVVQAASALADLKTAAADAAAELAATVADGLAGVIADFAGPREVAQVRAGRIAATLAGGGINATEQQIIGATRADIVALWRSVGDEGRAAILDAYDAWQTLQQGIQDAAVADIISGIASSADELLSVYAEISPQTQNLVGQWRDAGQQIDQLADALSRIDGSQAVSAVDALSNLIGRRDRLQGVVDSNADRALQLRVGVGDQSALALLRTREAGLWTRYNAGATAELAEDITQTTLQRIQIEGRLREQQSGAAIAALEQQISAAEHLRDLAGQMEDFVLGLRAGSLSALGYIERLQAGQQMLTRAIATGGDVQGSASALLQSGQQAYGGATGAYADLFSSVVDQLDAFGATAGGADATLTDAQAQLSQLQQISDTSLQQAQALDALNLTFGRDVGSLSATIAEQTTALQTQLAELRAVRETLEAQIRQAADAYQRLIDASTRTADAVEAIDDRAELEAAAP